MLLFSDSVTLIEKRKRRLGYSTAVNDAARASALACPLALSSLVRGLLALTCFPTVSRAMPSFRAMAHCERPWLLASCTASQLNYRVGVGVWYSWWWGGLVPRPRVVAFLALGWCWAEDCRLAKSSR